MKILIVLSLLSASAFAATINIPADYATIQAGINAAVNGDMVLVSPGTYKENIDFMGKAITVKSLNKHQAIIDGNQNGSSVTFAKNERLDSILDGFSIINGTGTYLGSPYAGKGVYCLNSSPTIRNNQISSFFALTGVSAIGGGIYLENSDAVIKDNYIYNNKVLYGPGGGIASYDSNPIIEDNIITNNKVYDDAACGGGVFMKGGIAQIKNNSISFNYSEHGGGLYLNGITGIIDNNSISNNTCSTLYMDGEGAGICIYAPSNNLKIRNNVIKYNHGEVGGGVYCMNGVYTNNIIKHNDAYDGAGVFCTFGVFKNNLIHQNIAQNRGGGLYSNGGLFENNTIYKNSATLDSGGVYGWNSKMKNSILWNNVAPTSPEAGGNATITYSDVEGGYPGVGNISADPLFVNGFRLEQDPCQPGVLNPCVDTGDNLAINLNMHTCWTRSDGIADSGVVDMGYHYGPYEPFTLSVEGYEIPENMGGSMILVLNAGFDFSARNYLIFGGVTGTAPGTPFPGGQVVLPINWDLFTNVVIAHANQPIFQNFMGQLNSVGKASAKLNTPPITGLAGIKMCFAYGLVDSMGMWDFASNAVEIEVIP